MQQPLENADESPAGAQEFNRRRFERFALPVGYTTIIVQRGDGESLPLLTGHVYDISESGLRFELDEPLNTDERVIASVVLPCERDPIVVHGRVVWLNDELDDPGPRRMALRFDEFATVQDHHRLVRYLSRGQLIRAA